MGKSTINIYKWSFSIATLVITRGYIPLNPIKPPFSYGFPMVFLWFIVSPNKPTEKKPEKKPETSMPPRSPPSAAGEDQDCLTGTASVAESHQRATSVSLKVPYQRRYGQYPHNIWPEIWYVYVPPSIGS